MLLRAVGDAGATSRSTQIGPGTEPLARRREDDRSDAWSREACLEKADDPFPLIRRHRVPYLGAVEGDPRHPAVDPVLNLLFERRRSAACSPAPHASSGTLSPPRDEAARAAATRVLPRLVLGVNAVTPGAATRIPAGASRQRRHPAGATKPPAATPALDVQPDVVARPSRRRRQVSTPCHYADARRPADPPAPPAGATKPPAATPAPAA